MSASAASVPYGLVSSSTSDPRSWRAEGVAKATARLGATAAHLVDRKASRLRKMKHGVLTNARLLNEQGRRGGFRHHAVMVTLTYGPDATWHGRQISSFLHAVRQWHKRLRKHNPIPMRCVWTAEMQQRGAVHYHVVFWLPSGFRLPKPDKRGWWPHGSTRIDPARTGVGYIAKYASKGADGPAFPRGVRIHGACGLDADSRVEARFWRAPSEARAFFGPGADVRPITGGRVCARTGLFWRSPWRLVSVCGALHMFRIEEGSQS